ncbi:unnamed protein product [Linum tenue]|uniref:Uncharacterized protein n=1 Tax=Linum tenue TaxID=586396 RepID=A0AAV0IP52_9ROSI|nr:unnamed protein product [Linum tenue]
MFLGFGFMRGQERAASLAAGKRLHRNPSVSSLGKEGGLEPPEQESTPPAQEQLPSAGANPRTSETLSGF